MGDDGHQGPRCRVVFSIARLWDLELCRPAATGREPEHMRCRNTKSPGSGVVANARALGARDRGFESHLPDHPRTPTGDGCCPPSRPRPTSKTSWSTRSTDCRHPSVSSSGAWPSSSRRRRRPRNWPRSGRTGCTGCTRSVPRTSWSADAAPLPSKITIFRGPLIRANRTPDRLTAAVRQTVYHEIAHHLGISDARLHELASERTGR